jgi:myo-inositol-1(or 4)-monophosphatase
VSRDLPDGALETAISAAREAGDLLKRRFQDTHDIRHKGIRDVVTEVDLEAQALIAERLRSRFPSHSIWAEEGDAARVGARAGYTWVVDPLDGTSNYSRQHPTFAVSIALALGREVLLGAVYEPIRDFLFHGRRGGGAFVNGRPLLTSAVSEWGQALVACDWARDQATRARVLRMVDSLIPEVFTFRALGAAALGFCYVAAGWLDGYFGLYLNPWDVAAGALFVEEAGGTVTGVAGEPWGLVAGGFLASNGPLHPHLVRTAGTARDAENAPAS